MCELDAAAEPKRNETNLMLFSIPVNKLKRCYLRRLRRVEEKHVRYRSIFCVCYLAFHIDFFAAFHHERVSRKQNSNVFLQLIEASKKRTSQN